MVRTSGAIPEHQKPRPAVLLLGLPSAYASHLPDLAFRLLMAATLQ